jgi:hypothetical protein
MKSVGVMTAHLCYSDAGDDTHCHVISKRVDVEISLQSDGYMLLFLQFSFPKYARSFVQRLSLGSFEDKTCTQDSRSNANLGSCSCYRLWVIVL